MPAKNAIKQYLAGGFYHAYNRGVEKRLIFLDDLDYKMFLSYLKGYLLPRQEKQVRPVRQSSVHEVIQLICYVLMPNHFHLLLKQDNQSGIIDFMRRIANAYTRYFNDRYQRVGPLFQGRYKAVLIDRDVYLLHLTRYVHLNPVELDSLYRSNLLAYPYSSYGEYLGKRKTVWIHPESIIAFFKTAQKASLKDVLSYQSFVEDYQKDSEEVLGDLTLDHEDRSTDRSDLFRE